jgi:glycosyltransferase involved in cell wall biosynthesis
LAGVSCAGDAPNARLASRAEQDQKTAEQTADAYFAVSKPLKDQIAARTHAPGAVLPCHVDVGRFDLDAHTRDQIRAQLGIQDRITVCYSGSLRAWQCVKESVALAAALRRLEPRIHLLVLTQRVSNDIAEALELVGKVNADYRVLNATADDVPRYLCASDAGLLLRAHDPINRVASPTKFGEYLAAGLPVITTIHSGDAAGIARSYGCGVLLSEPNVSNSDAVKVLAFLKDVAAHREQWASLARTVARQQFDEDRLLSEVAKCYQ